MSDQEVSWLRGSGDPVQDRERKTGIKLPTVHITFDPPPAWAQIFLAATSRLANAELKRPKISRPRREAPGSRFRVIFHIFWGQNTSRPRREPPALSKLWAAAWPGVRTLGRKGEYVEVRFRLHLAAHHAV